MSGTEYAMLAYVLSFLIFTIYGVTVWIERRKLAQRRSDSEPAR